MERVGYGKDEDVGTGTVTTCKRNMGIIPRPNARTYMPSMTAVSRSFSSWEGRIVGKNGDSNNENEEAYAAVVCRSLLQSMSENCA